MDGCLEPIVFRRNGTAIRHVGRGALLASISLPSFQSTSAAKRRVLLCGHMSRHEDRTVTLEGVGTKIRVQNEHWSRRHESSAARCWASTSSKFRALVDPEQAAVFNMSLFIQVSNGMIVISIWNYLPSINIYVSSFFREICRIPTWWRWQWLMYHETRRRSRSSYE